MDSLVTTGLLGLGLYMNRNAETTSSRPKAEAGLRSKKNTTFIRLRQFPFYDLSKDLWMQKLRPRNEAGPNG
jgi:hypothetical protein